MTAGVDFMPCETAAELTGLSIPEIDAAAADGTIPAHYTGWLLLVDPSSLMPVEEPEKKTRPAKRPPKR